MKKQAGMIFLSTVALLGVIILVVLSQRQLIFAQIKAINRFANYRHSLQALELTMSHLIQERGDDWLQTCITHDENVVQRLRHHQGCLYTHQHHFYYYLVEDLGVFPCLQSYVGNLLYSTRHWRLTIISSEEKSLLLQVRIAKLWPYLSCQSSEVAGIKPGIVSWRKVM